LRARDDGNRPATLASVPTPSDRLVLLSLDGVVHTSDLAVQAFARHIADEVGPDRTRPIIAGMRGFLEDRPELIPPGIDLGSAEDGYQAVEILARTAGLSDGQVAAARLASRADLVGSAWAVDEAVGLPELLAAVAGRARVGVLGGPDDPAPAAVLDALGIDVDTIVDHVDPGPAPALVLVIGAGWAGALATAHERGCATAVVDRFRRRRGTPTYRATDLSGLLDPIRGWLRDDRLSPGRLEEGQDR